MNVINSILMFPAAYAEADIVPTLNDLFSTTPNAGTPPDELVPKYKYDIHGALIQPGSIKQGGGNGTKMVNIVFYGTHQELTDAIAPPTNIFDWGSQDGYKHDTGEIDDDLNPIMELTIYTPVNNSVWQHIPDILVGDPPVPQEQTELHGWQGLEPFASKV